MTNQQLFDQAQQFIPGGVNSPVRAFKGVGGSPIFIDHAQGPYVYDAEGKAYIDYVGSWGPMILGHAHPEVLEAVKSAVDKGLSYGAPTEIETELAQEICKVMPNIEQVRMVNSGTEATMTALRLARGYTGRDKILKFNGCYHGHSDSLLVKAGSGVLTLGIPGSPGVPESITQHTLTANFNDLDEVTQIFEKYPDDIAAIILEPIPGNMNCILPNEGFLEGLRSLCDKYNTVLIFDEVMCGFRCAPGGAQALYNIKPDLTTLGKVIGGGMPVGAFGGKKEIMQHLAPAGPVYQAGTLSGNPIAMTAGLTQLKLIQQPGFYDALEQKTTYLMEGMQQAANAAGIPFTYNKACSMFGFFFNELETITCFADVEKGDIERFKTFFHAMLQEGVYFAPSAYEAGFMSSVHTEEVLDETIAAARRCYSTLLN